MAMNLLSSRLFVALFLCGFIGVLLSKANAGQAIAPDMIDVMPGLVVVGAQTGEWAAGEDEFPRHEVRLKRGFRISALPVTRGQFSAFVEATGYASDNVCWVSTAQGWVNSAQADWRNPGFEQTDEHPAVCVSWNDAHAYISWLNKETGDAYRLPTESEWAFAARAGSQGRNFWGDSAYDSCTYANINDISAKNKSVKAAEPCSDGYLHTSPVGIFKPNEFGLYDIQGNAWEWVADCWTGDYTSHPLDGSATVVREGKCVEHVARGGSWYDIPGPVRLEAREHRAPDMRMSFIGFRLAADMVLMDTRAHVSDP